MISHVRLRLRGCFGQHRPLIMGLAGFTLADRLGAKSSPCSVPGCTRTWISIAGPARGQARRPRRRRPGRSGVVDVRPVPREVRARLRTSSAPAIAPGLRRHLDLDARRQQMEAFADQAPAAATGCAPSARRSSAALEDKTVPCAVPGCTRVVGLHAARAAAGRRARGRADAPAAPLRAVRGRLPEAEGPRRSAAASTAASRSGPGRADEQIQAYATGLPNEPPRRMCDECKADFGAIADREVRCRTSGCKKTWTWTRGDQLDACLAGKPAPKAPHRMCESCIGIYQDAARTWSGPAAAPAASGPGPTSAAASWRAPCAARPAIPIRSTARTARRRSASSRTGRSPARPTTARAPGPGPRRRSWRPACGPS